jgi:hypothetical protein
LLKYLEDFQKMIINLKNFDNFFFEFDKKDTRLIDLINITKIKQKNLLINYFFSGFFLNLENLNLNFIKKLFFLIKYIVFFQIYFR